MIENSVVKHPEVLIKMVLDAWNLKVSQFDKLLAELSDDQLLKEVCPGRNRGFYLLGHLISLADSIFPLLGYDKHAPYLWKPFVQTSDKENVEIPVIHELRQEWVNVTRSLREKMDAMSSDEWFDKHAAISDEDFLKEPHRNKLNVVLSRISHVDYHLGQIQFLKIRQ